MFFDISFGELVLIGAVGLVIIGPEKLPKVARTAGMLFGRAQRMASGFRADIERELNMAEMAELKKKLTDEAASFQDEMADSAAQLSEALSDPENRILPDAAAETAVPPSIPEAVTESVPAKAKQPRRRKPVSESEPNEAAAADITPTAPVEDAAPTPKKTPRKRKAVAEQVDLFGEPPAEPSSTDWGDRR